MIRWERMLPATSIARHSRVYSSITVRHFNGCPLAQASKTKSWATPHSRYLPAAAGVGSLPRGAAGAFSAPAGR